MTTSANDDAAVAAAGVDEEDDRAPAVEYAAVPVSHPEGCAAAEVYPAVAAASDDDDDDDDDALFMRPEVGTCGEDDDDDEDATAAADAFGRRASDIGTAMAAVTDSKDGVDGAAAFRDG
jgi:hypothetical protein